MTWDQLALTWFPPLSVEEIRSREVRLETVYRMAGYRHLELDRTIAVSVDRALEAIHNQGTQAAPIEQPAQRTASMAGKEGL